MQVNNKISFLDLIVALLNTKFLKNYKLTNTERDISRTKMTKKIQVKKRKY